MFAVLLAAAALAITAAAKQPTSVADPVLTPGVVRSDLTLEQIRATKWGEDHRLVSAAMKAQVYARYGFTGRTDPRCTPDPAHRAQTCEIDHRVPRCAGGADDLKNLSPQPYGGPWNAHDKDRVEAHVCRLIVTGAISLEAAQAIFLGDWTVAYLEFFGAPPTR